RSADRRRGPAGRRRRGCSRHLASSVAAELRAMGAGDGTEGLVLRGEAYPTAGSSLEAWETMTEADALRAARSAQSEGNTERRESIVSGRNEALPTAPVALHELVSAKCGAQGFSTGT